LKVEGGRLKEKGERLKVEGQRLKMEDLCCRLNAAVSKRIKKLYSSMRVNCCSKPLTTNISDPRKM